MLSIVEPCSNDLPREILSIFMAPSAVAVLGLFSGLRYRVRHYVPKSLKSQAPFVRMSHLWPHPSPLSVCFYRWLTYPLAIFRRSVMLECWMSRFNTFQHHHPVVPDPGPQRWNSRCPPAPPCHKNSCPLTSETNSGHPNPEPRKNGKSDKISFFSQDSMLYHQIHLKSSLGKRFQLKIRGKQRPAEKTPPGPRAGSTGRLSAAGTRRSPSVPGGRHSNGGRCKGPPPRPRCRVAFDRFFGGNNRDLPTRKWWWRENQRNV